MVTRETYRVRTLRLVEKIDALEDAAETWAERQSSGWTTYNRRIARRGLIVAAMEVSAAARALRRVR